MEKLAIEERYWADQGVEWCLVTEKDIDLPLVRNIERLRPFAILLPTMGSFACDVEELAPVICRAVTSGAPSDVLTFCRDLDAAYGKPGGAAMGILKYLLASKRILADMSDPTPFERRI